MSILKVSRDAQVCQYDFNDQGGAIGVYGLGLFTDNNLLLDTMFLQPLVAFNSGGLATISFGCRFSNGFVVPANLVAPTAFGGPFVFLGPQFISLSLEIVMVIGGAPLTAGRIMVITEYFNTDF
jgi:hypothetical protein